MRTLIVDRIGADFRPDAHAVLGSWCFFGAENIYPAWEEMTFIDPFPTGKDRFEATEAVRALANNIVTRLWPEMNRRHNTAYSRAFWHAVLMNWILHLILMTWRLWRHVEIFIERSKAEPFEVKTTTTTGVFRFADTREFVMACFNGGVFRSWLIGEVVRRQAPSSWVIRGGVPVDLSALPRTQGDTDRAPRLRLAMENVNGTSFLQRVLFSMFLNLLPRRPSRPRLTHDGQVGHFPQPFLTLVDELVVVAVPDSFR